MTKADRANCAPARDTQALNERAEQSAPRQVPSPCGPRVSAADCRAWDASLAAARTGEIAPIVDGFAASERRGDRLGPVFGNIARRRKQLNRRVYAANSIAAG